MRHDANAWVYVRHPDWRGRFEPTHPSAVWLEAELVQLEVEQELGQPFSIRLRFRHEAPDLETEDLLEREVSVQVMESDHPRWWNGIVERASWLGVDHPWSLYELELRPAMNRLSYEITSRVWHQSSLEEVVDPLLQATGQATRWLLEEPLGSQPYTAQYREDSLSFVEQRLAADGVQYWFEHESGGHSMVISDTPSAGRILEQPFTPVASRVDDPALVTSLELTARMTHDALEVRAWDWMRPRAVQRAAHAQDDTPRYVRQEFVSALQVQDNVLVTRTQRAQQAHWAQSVELTGSAARLDLAPGDRITIDEALHEDMNGEYVVTRTRVNTVVDGEAACVQFAATPAPNVPRPVRRARSRAGGRDVAYVTGTREGVPDVDSFGQATMRFFWETGSAELGRARRFRVVQPVSARSMQLPRVGWEVAVAHLCGDPESPIISGRHFNERFSPDPPVPGYLAISSWSTRVLGDTGESNTTPGHELRFDDSRDAMQLGWVSIGDFFARVGGHRIDEVGGLFDSQHRADVVESVGLSQYWSVGGDTRLDVAGRAEMAVSGEATIRVDGVNSVSAQTNARRSAEAARLDTVVGSAVAVSHSLSLEVSGAMEHSGSGLFVTTVGGSRMEYCDGDRTERSGARIRQVGGSLTEQSAGTMTVESAATRWEAKRVERAGQSVVERAEGSIKVSAAQTIAVAGATIGIASTDALTLSGGGATMRLEGERFAFDASALSTQAATIKLVGQVVSPNGSGDSSSSEGPGDEDDWLELVVYESDGRPHARGRFVVTDASGRVHNGSLDGEGRTRLAGLAPGVARVELPDLSDGGADG